MIVVNFWPTAVVRVERFSAHCALVILRLKPDLNIFPAETVFFQVVHNLLIVSVAPAATRRVWRPRALIGIFTARVPAAAGHGHVYGIAEKTAAASMRVGRVPEWASAVMIRSVASGMMRNTGAAVPRVRRGGVRLATWLLQAACAALRLPVVRLAQLFTVDRLAAAFLRADLDRLVRRVMITVVRLAEPVPEDPLLATVRLACLHRAT